MNKTEAPSSWSHGGEGTDVWVMGACVFKVISQTSEAGLPLNMSTSKGGPQDSGLASFPRVPAGRPSCSS
jgi:hypothetical protein